MAWCSVGAGAGAPDGRHPGAELGPAHTVSHSIYILPISYSPLNIELPIIGFLYKSDMNGGNNNDVIFEFCSNGIKNILWA